ncbi:MAG: GGDEF domain-containing protein [Microcoleaceae cyanobacterium]
MLTYEIERTRRTRQALAIIIFDIDFFLINDTYSHQVGDGILSDVVALVKQQIRAIDSLYRIGGQEFAILCPNANYNQVLTLAERVIKSI